TEESHARGPEKFGRSTFEMHALTRLQKLEVFVCQERLKLLGAIKGTRELQHNKIQQLLGQESGLKGSGETKALENEVYESQLGIFDIGQEMLKEEEEILRRQREILDQAWHQEELDDGIFYDAVEERDQLDEDSEAESSVSLSKQDRLKQRLNRLYRKRAYLRNKRKACVAEHQKKVKRKEERQRHQHHSVQIKREETHKRVEMTREWIISERIKTLERLREYKRLSTAGPKPAAKKKEEPTKPRLSIDLSTILSARTRLKKISEHSEEKSDSHSNGHQPKDFNSVLSAALKRINIASHDPEGSEEESDANSDFD
ncbi:unnamed protein product, partial [Ixodes hexagonus]